jgi:hypothetical protein
MNLNISLDEEEPVEIVSVYFVESSQERLGISYGLKAGE